MPPCPRPKSKPKSQELSIFPQRFNAAPAPAPHLFLFQFQFRSIQKWKFCKQLFYSHTEAKAKVDTPTHPPRSRSRSHDSRLGRAVHLYTCFFWRLWDPRGFTQERCHQHVLLVASLLALLVLSLALFLVSACTVCTSLRTYHTRLAIFGFGAIYKTRSQFELSPYAHRMSLIFPQLHCIS